MTSHALLRAILDAVPWAVVVTVLATLVTSASPFALYRYLNRPQPVTGVVPWHELRDGEMDLSDLGESSAADEMLFSDAQLAHLVDDSDAIGREERLDRNTRTFDEPNGEVAIPLVFQNRGDRDLRDYKITITFEELETEQTLENQVRLVNVDTETLTIDGLFCEPDRYRGEETDRLPSRLLVRMYRDIELPGHFVSLTGSLGSGTMESIILELAPPMGTDQFYIIIEIDSPDLFVGEQMFCQRIAVESDEG